MSISSDSADQVMRIMLEGEEICLKASGKAAIEIIKYVATILKKHQQTQGKTRLINLIRSGKQLDFFGVKKEDLPIFMKEAKRYGILFSALVDKQNSNGNVDIIVKAEDSSRVNRIVKKCSIATVIDEGELKAELTKAKQEKMNDKKDLLNKADVEEKKLNLQESENKENQHPLVEKNNKENQLKNLSKVLKKQEDNTKVKRKSVKEGLKEIKEELAKDKKLSSKTHGLSKSIKNNSVQKHKSKSR